MVLSKGKAKYGKTLSVHKDLLTDAMAAFSMNSSGRVLIGWHYQVLEFFTAVQRIGHYEVVGYPLLQLNIVSRNRASLASRIAPFELTIRRTIS